jgi:hypothetical protein
MVEAEFGGGGVARFGLEDKAPATSANSPSIRAMPCTALMKAPCVAWQLANPT